MTVDLVCLLILALWSIPLNHIPAIARVTQSNVAWGMGNRETSPKVPAWVERADRAQRNHHDNLAMIAAVILTAAVAGQADGVTAIASIVVVVMRLLHSLSYMLGIIGLRSLVYFAALGALLVIVWRTLT
ncbi:MAG: MAPEG family protein [Cyanobacteria bacterium Co-bin8]|nr:MAPEG family protein [Cyanobacteria bacterium Co-bin8]